MKNVYRYNIAKTFYRYLVYRVLNGFFVFFEAFALSFPLCYFVRFPFLVCSVCLISIYYLNWLRSFCVCYLFLYVNQAVLPPCICLFVYLFIFIFFICLFTFLFLRCEYTGSEASKTRVCWFCWDIPSYLLSCWVHRML